MSDREGEPAVFRQRVDGTGVAERLTKPMPGAGMVPESWHPTANLLLLQVSKNQAAEFTLWTLTLSDKKMEPYGAVKSSFPMGPVFSPDGRWVAHSSNEAGANRVYVQPFPATGAKYQLYAREGDSGHHVLWSPDGKELFFNPRPAAYEVVSVRTQPTVAFGNPTAVPRPFQTGPPQVRRPFDINPITGKFVALALAGGQENASNAPEVHVVLNWFEELKQRVPVK